MQIQQTLEARKHNCPLLLEKQLCLMTGEGCPTNDKESCEDYQVYKINKAHAVNGTYQDKQ